MTDWPNQITEFQRTCMEQQQQLLSKWFGTLQQPGTGTPQHTWQQAVDTLEQQVNGVLDAQQQSFKAMLKSVEQAGHASSGPAPWEHQAEASVGLWTDMQHRIWKTWFDMLRNTSPARQEPGQALVQNWQNLVQQAVGMQQQWLATWAAVPTAGKAVPEKRSKKSPP